MNTLINQKSHVLFIEVKVFSIQKDYTTFLISLPQRYRAKKQKRINLFKKNAKFNPIFLKLLYKENMFLNFYVRHQNLTLTLLPSLENSIVYLK